MIKARSVVLAVTGLAALLTGATVQAAASKPMASADAGLQRYVVELADPPLALYADRALSAPDAAGAPRPSATAKASPGPSKLDRNSPEARAYLDYLNERQQDFQAEAARLLGRPMTAVYRYRNALNGMTLDLTAEEAEQLSESPLLRSIAPDTKHYLHTDAGPEWIGAAGVWNGLAGFPAARGEGVVVGVIDSGINWEHPSFDDSPFDGYDYVNPFGQYLGLCDDPEVPCNDKLVGVYDFVEDDPATEDVVEEYTKGRDNDGHGSHVASIAVGNPINVFLNGAADATLSGVAPRATLITYRVCYVGEPQGVDTGGCAGSAILSAIDQAIADGVDVINYSIGSSPSNPWINGSISRAFLAARGAGIFVATSTGNEGPNPGTVGSPANAPWILAVGNATHDRVFGSLVQNLVGGDTTPPEDLVGASLSDGVGQRQIVHAKDYGFPLCGAGEPELQATCDGNTGASNPWAGQTPFNGEIVVCDRGTYGRVEKGKNLLLAGAGGYILANTQDQGESVVSDEHCLPSSHIGATDGDTLRAWLDSGSGHGGSISGFTLAQLNRFGDQLSQSSSRGPALPPVEDVMKPNLMAPGSSILAAIEEGQEFGIKSGTSMASPHVAGAAALLKSVHGDWGPSELASVIETTSTAELATNAGAEPATVRDRGAGRPQLGEAVNAGLYLNVTASQFSLANPATGGDPGALNLPGLIEPECRGSCNFTRSVTDLMGGGSWTASAVDFPPGVSVSVNPSSFNLASGASRSLSVNVDVTESQRVGEWLDGRIRLRSAGAPDQFLTVSVFYSGGELPAQWSISDDGNGGWALFNLSGLAAMPDATFSSGGLQAPVETTETLPEDPSNGDPYDGGEGVFTVWHEMPQGALWLYAETLPSTAPDIDLFVGRDDNGNGFAEEFEELCSSTTPTDIERCDLFDQPPGDYWVLVQNWTASSGGFSGGGSDQVSVLSAGIGPGAGNNLAASGPGIVGAGEAFTVRLSWDNLSAVTGDELIGAVGIGTSRNDPNNIGVIPVRFTRDGIGFATFPLYNGTDQALALPASGAHDRLFIDVPATATGLTVTVSADDAALNDNLGLELRRMTFSAGLADPPFAASPAGASTVVSAGGSANSGPSATVSGSALQAGRWYAVLSNDNNVPAGVSVRADLSFGAMRTPVHRGLWEPSSRPGLGQGFEYNWGESDRALIWYSYDEAGQPAWYIAGAPDPDAEVWVAPLYRVTNDGANQQLARVGTVSVTTLAEDDSLFSFTLFGESGTERMQPLSANTCPQVNGSTGSYTGLWYRGVDGLGGASVVMNASTQAQIHYLFDGQGSPRWLVAQDPDGGGPDEPELPMLQFSGYCAVCAPAPVSFDTMGTLERGFDSETAGSWTLDYLFEPPLSGNVQRTDPIVKLTGTLDCQ